MSYSLSVGLALCYSFDDGQKKFVGDGGVLVAVVDVVFEVVAGDVVYDGLAGEVEVVEDGDHTAFYGVDDVHPVFQAVEAVLLGQVFVAGDQVGGGVEVLHASENGGELLFGLVGEGLQVFLHSGHVIIFSTKLRIY